METILRAEADVELIGLLGLGEEICSRITKASPDVVLIVDEDSQREAITNLTFAILEAHPNLPIIRAGLTENVARVHSTHILPARGTDLIETIRSLPVGDHAENPRASCMARLDRTRRRNRTFDLHQRGLLSRQPDGGPRNVGVLRRVVDVGVDDRNGNRLMTRR